MDPKVDTLDEDESIKFETVSSKLTCPKCGEGNVILKIHPVNKRKNFACSNDDCGIFISFTSLFSDMLYFPLFLTSQQ